MSLRGAIADVLLPTACPACKGPSGLEPGSLLCSTCRAEVAELMAPIPVLEPVGGGWALGPYAGPLGALVRRSKYGRDPLAIQDLAQRLARAATGRIPWVDLVTHVPAARARRWRRGFDQAEVLARAVADAGALRYQPLLRRVRGKEQAGRSRAERLRSAPGAFRALDDTLSGRILLVDDVSTTGATAAACATELLGSGASRVYLVVAVVQGVRAP